MRLRKHFLICVSVLSMFLLNTNLTALAAFPEHEVTGVVQLDENGEDNFFARELILGLEKVFEQPVSVWTFDNNLNSAALKYLNSSPADGYTFFVGIERNNVDEKSNNLNAINYDDFECIFLTGEATEGVFIIPIEGYMSMQILQSSPEKFNYFSKGVIYGVYVKNGTPDEIKNKLAEAFKNAAEASKIKNTLEKNNVKFLGLTSVEAQDYLIKWRGGNFNNFFAKPNDNKNQNVAQKIDTPSDKKAPSTNPTPKPESKPDNKAQAPKKSGYPEHEITGIVQMSKGGATDVLCRAVTEIAAKELGQPINITNIAGQSGAIGMRYVYESKSDGYTILMGSEHAALHDKIGLSPLSYEKFKSIYLIGELTTGIIVRPGSKYTTLTGLIEDAKAHPRQIKCAVTGLGSTGWALCAFLKDVTGAEFEQVNYANGSQSIKAIESGEVECSICLLQHAIGEYQKGNISFLCVIAPEPDPDIPEVPSIIVDYPGFFKYLPWGAFYGIFIKDDVNPELIKTLSDAYEKAGQNAEFQAMLKKYHVRFLGYTGAKADDYIKTWRGNTLDGLITSGMEGLSDVTPPLPAYPQGITPPQK